MGLEPAAQCRRPQVYIPPLDEGEPPATYACAVHNPGTTLAPVFYKVRWVRWVARLRWLPASGAVPG